MALMTVNGEETDLRSSNRWSANKKLDVVLRLLRGEKLEEVSREVGVEAHRLAAWRDEFLDAGKAGAEGQTGRHRGGPKTPGRRAQDRRADPGERDLEEGGRKKGAPDAAAEAAEVSAEMDVPLATVCRMTGAPRSTVYHRRSRGDALGVRPGPKTQVSDAELTEQIRAVITDCPLRRGGPSQGPGPPPAGPPALTWARTGCCASCGTPACLRPSGWPSAAGPGSTTAGSSPMPPTSAGAPTPPWPGRGTTAGSGCSSSSTTTPTRPGPTWPRWATASPPSSPSTTRSSTASATSDPDVARGIKLRHDWGSQYRAHHFQGSLNWLGIEDDAAFVGEPQGNGVAERFIGTLKEQCLWARLSRRCRRAPPSGRHLHRDLQQRVAHRTPRATAHHERRSSRRRRRWRHDEPKRSETAPLRCDHSPATRGPGPRVRTNRHSEETGIDDQSVQWTGAATPPMRQRCPPWSGRGRTAGSGSSSSSTTTPTRPGPCGQGGQSLRRPPTRL